MIEKLKHSCHFIHSQLTKSKILDDVSAHEMVKDALVSVQLRPTIIEKTSVLKLYYLLISLLLSKETEITSHWDTFQVCLKDNEYRLPIEEKKDVHIIAAYCLLRAISHGVFSNLEQLRKGYADMFVLWKKLVEAMPEMKALKEGEHIKMVRFLNIMSTALYNKQIDWAEKFVENGLNYVIPADRELAQKLSLATLAFYKGNYKSMEQHLHKLRAPISYYYEVCGLLMRAAYLTSDGLLYDNHDFDKVLQRVSEKIITNEIPAPRMEGYQKLFNYLKTMLEMQQEVPKKPHTKKEDWLALYQKLESDRPVAQKMWLLEQIAKYLP